jgi:hypothetical protein
LCTAPIQKYKNVNANLAHASRDTVNVTKTAKDAHSYADAKDAETRLKNFTLK